jgi:hypothetical protein
VKMVKQERPFASSLKAAPSAKPQTEHGVPFSNKLRSAHLASPSSPTGLD